MVYNFQLNNHKITDLFRILHNVQETQNAIAKSLEQIVARMNTKRGSTDATDK